MPIDRNHPMPLHYQVYTHLKEWFTTSFEPGDILPPEVELAEKLGVGRGTVRMAMDNLVQEGLIRRTAGKGSFLSEDYFIHLKRYRIGVILSQQEFGEADAWEYTWVHHVEMINGIIRGAGEYNIECELIPEAVLSSRHNDLFDGFVAFRYLTESTLDLITAPLVSVRYDVDLEEGFRTIGRAAAAMDRSRMVYMGTRKKGRVELINRILAELNREPISEDRIYLSGGSQKEAYGVCEQILDREDIPDFIICSTDLRALGVLECLADRNIRVPEDIAVFGFDGIRRAEVSTPPLSTYQFDWRFPGMFAIREMRMILDGRSRPVYEPLRGSLVLRGTTPEIPGDLS